MEVQAKIDFACVILFKSRRKLNSQTPLVIIMESQFSFPASDVPPLDF